MLVGYARVSTHHQSLEQQLSRLQEKGCEKVFSEKQSGGSASRLELRAAIDFVREGDTLIVTKLDRLARSAVDLGNITKELESKRVDLVVLDQQIDTTTASGRLMFHMISAFAEFERDLIRERCREGLQRAKKQGVILGRRAKLTDKQVEQLKSDIAAGHESKASLAKKYGISTPSVYRLTRPG